MSTPDPAVLRRVTEFWMAVQRAGDDECWPWTGYVNEDGYGGFFFGGRMVGAHELAVTFSTGEVRLPQLDTCHSCGHRVCCNPRHLRFDTRQSNVGDTVRMGRNHRPQTRLTDADVRLLRERRAAGAAQIDLAEQFGISQGLVSMIINGHRRIEAGGPIATRRNYKRSAA